MHRAGEDLKDEDVARLRRDLLSLAMHSVDPRIREELELNEEHFRTYGSIRHQARFVRALGREPWRAGFGPPRNLEGPWDLYKADPQAISRAAANVRGAATGVEDVGSTNEAEKLSEFLDDAYDLIAEVARVLPQLPGLRVDRIEIREYLAAWEDLRQRPFRGQVRKELERAENTRRLFDVGLAGPQLAFKLKQFARSLRDWYRTRKVESLMDAFRQADIVLGSLSQALPVPGVDVFKEFKEGTEAILDRSLPPRGICARTIAGIVHPTQCVY